MKKPTEKPKHYRVPGTSPSLAFVPQPDKKLKVLYISEDAWCASIYFLFGATPERYAAWIKGMFGREDKEANHHYFTTEIATGSGATVDVIAFRDELWNWNIQQMATLVHECHHVTTNILMRKGIRHSRETEEVWAYLQDSIYQRISWALKNPAKVDKLARFTERLWAKPRPKKRRLAKKRGSK